MPELLEKPLNAWPKKLLRNSISRPPVYYRGMAFPAPQFSRTQVNNAGKLLVKWDSSSPKALLEAYEVLTNWRSSHGYPINTFQMTLRSRVANIDPGAIVAQRLKRTPSIVNKLRRFPKMKLSTMQDIGGLRCIVGTQNQLDVLRGKYIDSRHASFEHELVTERNYVDSPKESGYRSIHLVYRYKNRRAPDFDGLLIEIQLRTQIQHLWATAVETVGTFLNQALKSSEGPDEWLSFFGLMGSALAHLEKGAPVPGYGDLAAKETYKAVVSVAAALHVREQLDAYSVAADHITKESAARAFHLIVLDTEEKAVHITSFSQLNLEGANQAYTGRRKRSGEKQFASGCSCFCGFVCYAAQGLSELLSGHARVPGSARPHQTSF